MADSHSGAAGRGAVTESEGPSEQACQQLWFALARRPWASIVLVPADPGVSTDRVARALADVGKRLSDTPVTAVTVASLEYGTAVALADLPQFVARTQLAPASPQGHWPTVDSPASPSGEPAPGGPAPALEPGDPSGGEALVVSSAARLIISIPSVVSEPLGLATTQTADLVVLCVEMGRTRLENARRTVKLIGRERLAGCFLIG